MYPSKKGKVRKYYWIEDEDYYTFPQLDNNFKQDQLQ